MIESPLVSVIIPTYNRADLIGETLDSLLAQTYENWECIVVDDGSSDHTDEVMQAYVEKDSRIQYYHRPEEHLPGGNGARNYGFKRSNGQFIQWFDSDDLMVEKKIEKKVNALLTKKVDFVISKTKYFNHKNNSFFNYQFEESQVSFESYAIDYIRWHTPDLMLKRNIAEKISFNEILKAGQEHNFNCKLLLQTSKLAYIKEFLTLRRFTPSSIQGKRDINYEKHLEALFNSNWYNYLDLKNIANNAKFNRFSLLQCANSYLNSNKISLPKEFSVEIRRIFPNRFYFFYLAVASKKISGKWFYFYKRLKGKEVFNTYSF